MLLQRKLKKAIGGMALLFTAASCGAEMNAPDQGPEGLWKLSLLDAVMEIKKCENQSYCASFYWIHPKAKDVFHAFGSREARQQKPFADQFRISTERNPHHITERDVLSLCGYAPKTDLKKIAADTWKGTMELRGYNMTVNVTVTQTSPTEASATFSKGPFSRKDMWQRIDGQSAQYPRCEKPGA